MKFDLEDISAIKKKVNITVPKDIINEEFKNAFTSVQAGADIKGFRKGKAPVDVIKKIYGEKIKQDVVTKIVETSYIKALQELKVVPVANPDFDMKEIEENKDFSYSATLEVQPEIKLKDYSAIKIDKKSEKVSKKEVDESIDRLKAGRATFKEVTRKLKSGDMAIIDFEGFVEGEAFEGGKAENFSLETGENRMIPGFEDNIIGMKIDEEKEISVTFPKDYQAPDLAGKVAKFNIKLNSVKEKVLPEIDDEFAKDFECDTLDALKEKIKDELNKHKEDQESNRRKNKAVEELTAMHDFEVPESMLERYNSMILNNVMQQMQHGMMHPEDKDLGPEELKEKYRKIALMQLKGDLLLDAIAEKETIELTDDELENKIVEVGARQGMAADKFREKLQDEGNFENFKGSVTREKVLDFLIEGK